MISVHDLVITGKAAHTQFLQCPRIWLCFMVLDSSCFWIREDLRQCIRRRLVMWVGCIVTSSPPMKKKSHNSYTPNWLPKIK